MLTRPSKAICPTFWGNFTADDGILTKDEQSLTAVIPGVFNYADELNYFGTQSNYYACYEVWPFSLPLHQTVLTEPRTLTLVENEILISFHTPPETTKIVIKAKDGKTNLDWSGSVNFEIHGPSGLVRLGSQVPSTYYDAPPGCYNVVYTGGGPGPIPDISPSSVFCVGGANDETGDNYFTGIVTLNFRPVQSGPPIVTTQNALGLAGDGATLASSVNPNGATTNAWFEWGTSSSLAPFTPTSDVSVGIGASSQTITMPLSGLQSNNKYYFRIAAGNGATPVRGSIVSFTTLTTLPRPVLQLPSNGASSVPMIPSFFWTSVANASSYRLIIATSPGSLPTDPTSAACGNGCVLNETPSNNSYTPTAGILSSGVT